MDEFNINRYENETDENIDKNKIKLNYDYQSYENFLNNNSIIKTLDLLSNKDDKNNEFLNKNNNNLNSNLNEPKNNISYIPNYYMNTQNTNNYLFDNNFKSKFEYNDEMKIDENKMEENKYVKKNRNNSYNYSKIKINLRPNGDNMTINNFEKNIKYKENNLTNIENEQFYKKESNSDYNINIIKDIDYDKNKIKNNKKYFYSTFNKLPDYLRTANEDLETYNKINEINNIISEENKSNNIQKIENKKFKNNNS